MKLQELKSVRESDLIAVQHEKDIAVAQARAAAADFQKKAQEAADLRAETIKAIRGESAFDSALLNSLIAEAQAAADAAKAVLDAAQSELTEQLETTRALQKEYDRILT